MSRNPSLEERRAQLIIKYRNMTPESEKPAVEGDKMIWHLRNKKEGLVIMHAVVGQKTIGISFVRELKEMVEKEGAEKGILVGDGKYTYSARSSAEELGIELIPPTLPTFDIFEHVLVPLHEIVGEEEVKAITERYHAEPYQFPWIKATDPISIILGAKSGDVLRVTQDSSTAGKSISYRYVV